MTRTLIFILFSFFIHQIVKADNKAKIIENLKNTSNINFEFEQNINGKIQNGSCTIEYPKKIFCKYRKNNKIMVSNGKSLVIKTEVGYSRYPVRKTPLNFILDKDFLIKKIYKSKEKIIDRSYISYTINKNNNKIDVFFDINSFNLLGWRTKDIYQNTALTLIYSISKNKKIKKQLFKLPPRD